MFHLFGVKETEIFSIYTKGERYMLCEFNKKKKGGEICLVVFVRLTKIRDYALPSYFNVEKNYLMQNGRPSSLKSDLV